jgi:hypothetical protein
MYKLLRFLMCDSERLKQFFYAVDDYKWIYSKNYIMGYPKTNAINVMITAHYDTVINDGKACCNMFMDKKRQVIFGACRGDDRAGCYAVYKIITESKVKPFVVLCDKEEASREGSENFIKDYETNLKQFKFPDFMNGALFYIALDRQGNNDAVYYTSNNGKFEKFIKKAGFKEAEGSISDIKLFEEEYKKCGVNLSIGYTNNHTCQELLNVQTVEKTICKVKNILELSKTFSKPFDYQKKVEKWNWKSQVGYDYSDYDGYNGRFDGLSWKPETQKKSTFEHGRDVDLKFQCENCNCMISYNELINNFEDFGFSYCNDCVGIFDRGNGLLTGKRV